MQTVRPLTRLVLVLALAVGAGAGLAGCGAGDPYPILDAGSNQRSWGALEQPIPAVVLYVTARPGDSVELLGAEAIGTLDGATVELVVSRPILDANGNHVTGDMVEPLEGAIIATEPGPNASASASAATVAVGSVIPGEPVGIVATITAQQPGRFTIDSIRLRYRLNGGSEHTGEGTVTRFTVCAADPTPTDCPESDAEEPEE